MHKLTINGSWTQFVSPLRKREAFKTHGSLRGAPTNGYGPDSVGRLWRGYDESLRGADYVVYSYATPIAWHRAEPTDVRELDAHITFDESGYWVQPNDRYSVTTSKQQGRIATALSVISDSSYN